jgi:ABC-type transport system involved in cytochrome c biogenesis permease subunit
MASNTSRVGIDVEPSGSAGTRAGRPDGVAPVPWGNNAGSLAANLRQVLAPLASLKLTVTLFALAIFLIFAGTLAQVDKDIWEVVREYFREYFAWIEFQVFFPPAFFPSRPVVPGGFYFPGGALIGALMAVNLLAAHGLRFKVQARGGRALIGGLVLMLGLLMTWAVIESGSSKDGLLEGSLLEWSTLWGLFKVGIAAVWVAAAIGLARLPEQRKLERRLLLLANVALAGLLAWLMYSGDSVRLADSYMRILWQLTKASFAAVIMLGGCVLLFKKRAGVVLLHGGIGLMMLSELLVAKTAVEGQMSIDENQTINYVQDIRVVELAVIDPSDPQHDDVVVIPQSLLQSGQVVRDESLPFDVQLVKFLKNAALRPIEAGDKNLAAAGAGLRFVADEVRPGAGTDTSSEVDQSAAYIELFKKNTQESLGTYLVALVIPLEKIAAGGKDYNVCLRFKRTYKPYSITLLDVSKDDYVGTNTPRNYSSDIHLVDPSRNVDRQIHIWMNNPLRFAGETFYQSGYHYDKTRQIESTSLQVVTNTGWMIPYVSCVIVAFGLLAHFSITLVRFLSRRSAPAPLTPGSKLQNPRDGRREASAADNVGQAQPVGRLARYFPLLVLLVFGGYVVGKTVTPRPKSGEMDLYAFGQLPVAYEGRIKPLDTLARNSLKILSDRQTFTEEVKDAPPRAWYSFQDPSQKTQPAIRWLLDVITDSEDATKHRVIRIENLEVLDLLGLKRRKSYRYSIDEFRDKLGDFYTQVELADKAKPEQLSTFQKKVIDLHRRLRSYALLVRSFRTLPLPAVPTEEDFKRDQTDAIRRFTQIKELLNEVPQLQEALEQEHAPLAVPSPKGWQPYSVAAVETYLEHDVRRGEGNPAALSLEAILEAYQHHDAGEFNRQVEHYQNYLVAHPPSDYDVGRAQFEGFFNYFEPFYLALTLYVVAFVLAAAAWLGWTRPLNRSAFWLIAFTFALHTFALVSRIYISGRPPVTNLYSASVFIGWGCVLIGIVLELLFGLGIGNVVAAIAGFATLLIAHFLSTSGDTFTVLQAVLDTQFWLATHVVCITLGYATTYLAGLLGIVYILRGALTPSLSPKIGKDLVRMIYGILCFAIFFSFVGTVLGGLWADDSWGRFWGWDPKENGALMIVLWNALVLHARWDGLVKDRGLAALAVAGNIAVSWSFFGVNELGVGLHAYGGSDLSIMERLGIFSLTQLAIIALALLPRHLWWSNRAQPA